MVTHWADNKYLQYYIFLHTNFFAESNDVINWTDARMNILSRLRLILRPLRYLRFSAQSVLSPE